MINMALRAGRRAGQIMVRQMDRIDTLNIVEKARNDFVSEVDRDAEDAIIDVLHKAYPDHGIIGEEHGESFTGAEYTWIIDPLDGTHNYLRGIPHYSVSIALCEDGEPQHGVVLDPVRDELFTASRGGGAFLNDKRMRVATRTGLADSMLITGFPFRQRRHIDAHLAMVRTLLVDAGAEDIRRTGSAALDLAYVACGRADAFFEMGLKPWDMAAGALLVRESGGRCLDFRGEADFMTTGNLVAGNIKVSDALVKAIAPHLTPAISK